MPRLADERVLVVEDDDSFRLFLALTLNAHGAEARAVADGIAALSVVADFEPTVVVTDLRMPRLDGGGLCRRLRADPGHRMLPILVLSGLDDARLVGELAALGLVWYLHKDAGSDLLCREVANIAAAGRRARTATGRWLLPVAEPGYITLDREAAVR